MTNVKSCKQLIAKNFQYFNYSLFPAFNLYKVSQRIGKVSVGQSRGFSAIFADLNLYHDLKKLGSV
jgi:hypothetical protein